MVSASTFGPAQPFSINHCPACHTGPARPARARGQRAQWSPGGMVAKQLAPRPQLRRPRPRALTAGHLQPQEHRAAWKASRCLFPTLPELKALLGGVANVGNSWCRGSAALGMAAEVAAWPGSGLRRSALALQPGIWARPQLRNPGMPWHGLGHAGSCHSFYRWETGARGF